MSAPATIVRLRERVQAGGLGGCPSWAGAVGACGKRGGVGRLGDGRVRRGVDVAPKSEVFGASGGALGPRGVQGGVITKDEGQRLGVFGRWIVGGEDVR